METIPFPREIRSCPGRALWVTSGGTLYASRRLEIHRSLDRGRTWELDARVATPSWRRLACAARLGARLLRQDVQAFVVTPDGARLAVGPDGIHRADAGSAEMRRIFELQRGSRPIHLTSHPSGRVLFGEYGDNAERREVHLYVSDDGRRFDVGHTLPAGEARHVHNLLWDDEIGAYWLLVGDYGREPGIGLLDADLSHVTWVVRGSQQVRAVGAIVERGAILFGTDTETEANHIVRLEKSTGRMTVLREISGTSLYAGRYGSWRMLSTCVEPSPVHTDRSARLYASPDGENWSEAAALPKDAWSPRFFQFGTLVLPKAEAGAPLAMVAGQAVAGLDDRLRVLDVSGA